MSDPQNTRQEQAEADKKFLYAVIFSLVVVGGLLIAAVYGPSSLLTALPCLLGGVLVILLPWAMLTMSKKWLDKR